MAWVLLLAVGAFCCMAPAAAQDSAQTWPSHQGRGMLAEKGGSGVAAQQQDAASTKALCAKWGLEPAAAGAKPPRLFDFFIASQEYDMMQVRLEETHHELDAIFILESRQTFRGNPKKLAYPRVIPRLHGEVIRKVHYTVLDSLEGDGAWEKEEYQRNQMLEASLASSGITPDPQDVFIMSDTDEIPKPEFLRAMKQCAGIQYPLALESKNHYYSFNYVSGGDWNLGPTAMKAWQNANLTAQKLRHGNQWGHVETKRYANAAWHCSYCFNHARAFQTKLSSFSHSEFDTPDYHDLKRIVRCLTEGWGLFQGDIGQPGAKPEYTRLPPDQVDAPQYIHKHAERLGYLLNRDGELGGLVDVEVRNGSVQLLPAGKVHLKLSQHRRPKPDTSPRVEAEKPQ